MCRLSRVAHSHDDGLGEGDDGGTAQCHCGALRVIASGELERVYVCHCRACQRRTGAVVHSGWAYPKSQVRIEGDNKIYERDADSGFKIRFHFCPNCGSTTSWHWLPERGQQRLLGGRPEPPNIYGITAGSFADPNFPPPTYSACSAALDASVAHRQRAARSRPRRSVARGSPSGRCHSSCPL